MRFSFLKSIFLMLDKEQLVQGQNDESDAENVNDTDTATDENAENENSENKKTFTQAEVNRLMKIEKEKGKKSILKDLGVKDIKDAKTALEKYQEHLDSQKTELEKANETIEKLNQALKESELNSQRSEFALKAISKYNANPEYIDDLISIVVSKINDENDVESVFDELSKNKAFAGFFNSVKNKNDSDENNSKGTGSPVKNSKNATNSNSENYGARLAKLRQEKLNNGGK